MMITGVNLLSLRKSHHYVQDVNKEWGIGRRTKCQIVSRVSLDYLCSVCMKQDDMWYVGCQGQRVCEIYRKDVDWNEDVAGRKRGEVSETTHQGSARAKIGRQSVWSITSDSISYEEIGMNRFPLKVWIRSTLFKYYQRFYLIVMIWRKPVNTCVPYLPYRVIP